jgi:hypothetical protein
MAASDGCAASCPCGVKNEYLRKLNCFAKVPKADMCKAIKKMMGLNKACGAKEDQASCGGDAQCAWDKVHSLCAVSESAGEGLDCDRGWQKAGLNIKAFETRNKCGEKKASKDCKGKCTWDVEGHGDGDHDRSTSADWGGCRGCGGGHRRLDRWYGRGQDDRKAGPAHSSSGR